MKLGNVQVKALLILGWEIENQECYSDKILNDAYEFDFDLHVNCTCTDNFQKRHPACKL